MLSRLSRAFREEAGPLADLIGPQVATEKRVAIDLPPLGGRYKLLRPIGGGGMGTVYLARDIETGVDVAVKVPHMISLDVDRRFLLEAAALEAVVSPSIVSYLDQGAGVTPFLVTELLRGETLAERIRERGKLPQREAFATLRRLSAALAAVHVTGWVHRDIKPGNVLVSDTGEVRLIDFGLARPVEGPGAGTRTGQLMGTLNYLAPEQLGGEHVVDARADVFALGCIAYECCTAEHAFRRTVSDIAAGRWSPEQHVVLSPEARGVERPMAELVRYFTALRPTDRPQDGLESLAWMLSEDKTLRDCHVSHPLPREVRSGVLAGHRSPVVFVGEENVGKTEHALATAELLGEMLAPAGIVFLRGNPRALSRPGAHARALETLIAGYGYRNAARALAGGAISCGPDEPKLLVVADDVDAMDDLSVSRLRGLAEVGLARLVATARGKSPLGFQPIAVAGEPRSRVAVRPFARWVLAMAAMFGTTFPVSGVKRLIGGGEAVSVPRALSDLRQLGVVDNRSGDPDLWSFRSAAVWRSFVRTMSHATVRGLTQRVTKLQQSPAVEAHVVRFTSSLALPPKAASPGAQAR